MTVINVGSLFCFVCFIWIWKQNRREHAWWLILWPAINVTCQRDGSFGLINDKLRFTAHLHRMQGGLQPRWERNKGPVGGRSHHWSHKGGGYKDGWDLSPPEVTACGAWPKKAHSKYFTFTIKHTYNLSVVLGMPTGTDFNPRKLQSTEAPWQIHSLGHILSARDPAASSRAATGKVRRTGGNFMAADGGGTAPVESLTLPHRPGAWGPQRSHTPTAAKTEPNRLACGDLAWNNTNQTASKRKLSSLTGNEVVVWIYPQMIETCK